MSRTSRRYTSPRIYLYYSHQNFPPAITGSADPEWPVYFLHQKDLGPLWYSVLVTHPKPASFAQSVAHSTFWLSTKATRVGSAGSKLNYWPCQHSQPSQPRGELLVFWFLERFIYVVGECRLKPVPSIARTLIFCSAAFAQPNCMCTRPLDFPWSSGKAAMLEI